MLNQEPYRHHLQELENILAFDNNFIRLLLKGSFNHHLNLPDSDLRSALKTPFTPWRSVFSFMELIGLNPSHFSPPPFDLESVTDGNYIPSATRHFESYFIDQEKLQQPALEDRMKEQQEYVDPLLIDLWENLIHGYDGEDAVEWLQFALSFDAVYKINPPHHHRKDLHSELISAGFFKADYRIRNMSKFRLAYRMWLRARDILSRPEIAEETPQAVANAHKLIKIGNLDDYLDCDLIHLACLGAEEPDGTRHTITCLTCDSPEVIRMRLRLYKGFLNFIKNLYRDQLSEEGYSIDFESRHNGNVLCFSNDGELIETIDVSHDITPLPFIVHQSPKSEEADKK